MKVVAYDRSPENNAPGLLAREVEPDATTETPTSLTHAADRPDQNILSAGN
jgi:hypothetical protein